MGRTPLSARTARAPGAAAAQSPRSPHESIQSVLNFTPSQRTTTECCKAPPAARSEGRRSKPRAHSCKFKLRWAAAHITIPYRKRLSKQATPKKGQRAQLAHAGAATLLARERRHTSCDAHNWLRNVRNKGLVEYPSGAPPKAFRTSAKRMDAKTARVDSGSRNTSGLSECVRPGDRWDLRVHGPEETLSPLPSSQLLLPNVGKKRSLQEIVQTLQAPRVQFALQRHQTTIKGTCQNRRAQLVDGFPT